MYQLQYEVRQREQGFSEMFIMPPSRRSWRHFSGTGHHSYSYRKRLLKLTSNCLDRGIFLLTLTKMSSCQCWHHRQSSMKAFSLRPLTLSLKIHSQKADYLIEKVCKENICNWYTQSGVTQSQSRCNNKIVHSKCNCLTVNFDRTQFMNGPQVTIVRGGECPRQLLPLAL